MSKPDKPEIPLSTMGIAAWMVSAGEIFLVLIGIVRAHAINRQAQVVIITLVAIHVLLVWILAKAGHGGQALMVAAFAALVYLPLIVLVNMI